MANYVTDSRLAMADTYCDATSKYTNYGSANGMYAEWTRLITGEGQYDYDYYERYCLVEFNIQNLWSYPPGCILRLFIEECTYTEDVDMAIRLAKPFNEYTATYNLNWDWSRTPSGGSIHFTLPEGTRPGTTVDVDVSRLVKAAYGAFDLSYLNLLIEQYDDIKSNSREYVKFGTREGGHPAALLLTECTYDIEYVYCDKDAYVDSLNPNANNSGGKLFVTDVVSRPEYTDPNTGEHFPTIPAYEKRAFVHMGLSQYTIARRGAVDLYVVFTLDKPNSYVNDAQEFVVDIVDSGWYESTITWNNQPASSWFWVETTTYEPGSNELRCQFCNGTIYLDDFWGNWQGSSFDACLYIYGQVDNPYYQMAFYGRHETPELAARVEIWFPASPLKYASRYRYVDGVNGSDSNDGLTVSTPWKTMDHAAKTAPVYTIFMLQNDFTNEPLDGVIAPNNIPANWLNWVTPKSRIIPADKSPLPVLLYPIDDSFVKKNQWDSGDGIYGTQNFIELGDGDNNKAYGYLKFDISDLENPETKFYKLTMQVIYAWNNHEDPMDLYLELQTNNWNEETLTFNNNQIETADMNAFRIWTVPVAKGVYSIDVTPIFRGAVRLGYTECTIGMSFHSGYTGYGSDAIAMDFYTREGEWLGGTIPTVQVLDEAFE